MPQETSHNTPSRLPLGGSAESLRNASGHRRIDSDPGALDLFPAIGLSGRAEIRTVGTANR